MFSSVSALKGSWKISTICIVNPYLKKFYNTVDFSLLCDFPRSSHSMNYLITGGAGFIGSHLAESLLAKNHTVTVIDDLSTGSIRNIEHLKENKRFKYVIDSVMNKPLLSELVDGCQTIFHL